MTGAGEKLRFLFIHQNFPGQFVHLAGALARDGHEVVALGIDGRGVPGVRYLRYKPVIPTTQTSLPLMRDVEAKVVRGTACAAAMQTLAISGFRPDVIVAHPGWGEALFCKDIWPKAKLIVFAEFFYNTEGADYNFDPEFAVDTAGARSALRMKNTALLHALHACDAAYTPTHWQLSQLPAEFRHKVGVIFDGIDTEIVRPHPGAAITFTESGLTLTGADEVVTFVNRNLEPYRGFHSFMRALPAILKARPKAHCVIVGRDDVSYGRKPVSEGCWREVMLREVGSELPMQRVHFVGGLPYNEYLKVLQISTCHVYLTYPFVLGWSCVEAMAAGCVVVGSDTGPVKEVIEDGVSGLLVNFFDLQDIAGRVVDVLTERRVYAALGAAARTVAVQRYDLLRVSLPAILEFARDWKNENPQPCSIP